MAEVSRYRRPDPPLRVVVTGRATECLFNITCLLWGDMLRDEDDD